jgi:hypothetical protein
MSLFRAAQLFFLLAAPMALAGRVTVNPETELSLDFSVEGATVCILVPSQQYDPQACAGIPQKEASGVRALVIVRQAEPVFIITVTSIQRPEIGQMSDQRIRGFLQGTMKRLSGDFGAPVRGVEDAGKTYALQRVGGVPVVRWAYTTEVPDADERAHTASAVVYLIPSRDTLDILSINTHQQHLEAARSVGEQVISTLQVPLTIDAERFGGSMTSALGMQVGVAVVGLVLAIMLWVRLGRRLKERRHGQPGRE